MSISSMIKRTLRLGRKLPVDPAADRHRVELRRAKQNDVPERRGPPKPRDEPQPVEIAGRTVPAVTHEPSQSSDPAFLVTYVDVHGVRSERHLQIRSVFRLRQKLFVNAWCGQRQRERPFRVDRIEAMISASGQEITSPRQFLSSMTVDASVETESHIRAMAKAMPGLTALLWIGGPEAEFDEAKEDLMLEFIDRRAALGSSKRDHSWDRKGALAWIYDAAPGRGDCRAGLKRLDLQSGEIALLQEFADRMVLSADTADAAKAARRDDLLKWLAAEKKAARPNKRR